MASASSSHKDTNDDNEEFLNDDKVVLLVNLLTKHKIKLWEVNNLESNENPQTEDLVMKLSDESGLVENEVKEILIKLQKHSIKKLESNQRFNKDGIATFTVKVIGNNNNIQEKTFKQQIEISININGRELKDYILNIYQLDCDNLKLILNGKILRDDVNLVKQDVKNHSTIMAMCVYDRLSDMVNKNNEDFQMIADIKDAVSLLTDNLLEQKDENLNHFKLQDQNGLVIELSKDDKRCLTSAMILHEKAKISIKSKNYLKALILLAEADHEFKSCANKSLLEKVDNYALLNLDIVWCYLCLQNLHDLKNAEERLNTCEKSLEKCYGANLERLTLIQHDSLNKYRPIFIRVNLLKGILMYHKGKKVESKQFLDAANSELQKNIVDDEKLIQVMSMGFSNTQARLALRAANGNVDRAIEHIIKKKEREKELKLKDKEIAYAKKIDETYGFTIKDSKPINVKTLKDLMQFGYTEKRAATALIQSNNDFNLALDILQSEVSNSEFEDNIEPSTSTGLKQSQINDEVISQLTSMGFDVELCKLCLGKFNENIQKSIEFLLSKSNYLKNEEGLQLVKNELSKILDKKQESSIDDEKASKKRNAEELIANLAKDMPDDDEAYLDLNLDEDSFFINKYYSLLGI